MSTLHQTWLIEQQLGIQSIQAFIRRSSVSHVCHRWVGYVIWTEQVSFFLDCSSSLLIYILVLCRY